MSQSLEQLADAISARFAEKVARVPSRCGELTFEVETAALLEICASLRDDSAFRFEQLIDVAGVDYLLYGVGEWTTESATSSGFSRGRIDETGAARSASGDAAEAVSAPAADLAEGEPRRFAVVYHLLSVTHNRRVRLRAWCEPGDPPMLDSVVDVWSAANWFEREAFDLFGIIFRGHPDLRRILTDYGFVGHPFRKDFPLTGNVEVRYDPSKGRVIYQPVSIEPRTLVPRVIRDDSRYASALKDSPDHG
jgi:NADH-quinone oxidoreductase subunit C